jgi:hypothetical protein
MQILHHLQNKKLVLKITKPYINVSFLHNFQFLFNVGAGNIDINLIISILK